MKSPPAVTTPRNMKQLRYKHLNQRQISRDALYNKHELAYDIPGFIRKITTYPDLVCICGLQEILEEANKVLQLNSPSQLLSYDTTFKLGDFYVSPLLFKKVTCGFIMNFDIEKGEFIHYIAHWSGALDDCDNNWHKVSCVRQLVCTLAKAQIASLLATQHPVITFKFVDLQMQSGTYDCGLFAIAHATAREIICTISLIWENTSTNHFTRRKWHSFPWRKKDGTRAEGEDRGRNSCLLPLSYARWGLGPKETSNSGPNHDRWCLEPIETCYSDPKVAVLHPKSTDEGGDQ